jgi:hypothetical protein
MRIDPTGMIVVAGRATGSGLSGLLLRAYSGWREPVAARRNGAGFLCWFGERTKQRTVIVKVRRYIDGGRPLTSKPVAVGVSRDRVAVDRFAANFVPQYL